MRGELHIATMDIDKVVANSTAHACVTPAKSGRTRPREASGQTSMNFSTFASQLTYSFCSLCSAKSVTLRAKADQP